jgi:serine/threonine protein kinase
VWDERLLFPAVAKILRPDRVDDPRSLRALRREAELLRRLAHPVLVRGFDAVLEGPRPHLLLEHVDAANLRELIQEEVTLPAEEVLPAALDVLAALHYLAVNGVVHLDVKPSNIVMSVPARLIDLGGARTLEEAKGQVKPIGTTAYMAPEQCDPEQLGPIGASADVWGLGATLYHALTGNRPFSSPAPDGTDPVAHYPQLVEQPLRPPDYVPEAVANVIMSMLSHHPAERPTAIQATEVLEPLAASGRAIR